MKTKFNWGMFFTVLLVIACIYCAFYGILTAMVTKSWTPMWWITPGVLLIAGYAAVQKGKDEEKYSADARRDHRLDLHHSLILKLMDHYNYLDQELTSLKEKVESEYDCAE